MSKRFIDFDAMWAESMPTDEDRPRIKAFGEEIILPATLPARIMLSSMSASRENNVVEGLEKIVGHLTAFVGEERVNRWINQGASPTQLAEMFTHCLNLYLPERDEGDEGNATAPKTGAKGTASKRSSKSGA